jgi:hypothetical protein
VSDYITEKHIIGYVKKKANPSRCPHAGTNGERKYSSYLSLTSTVDGVNGERHALAAL